jgi:protein-disulfide isomerase
MSQRLTCGTKQAASSASRRGRHLRGRKNSLGSGSAAFRIARFTAASAFSVTMWNIFAGLNAMTNGASDRAMPHDLYSRRAAGEDATLTRMPHTVQLVEPVSPADHMIGPHSAPVTVVEYGDFECPRCKQAAGALKLLFARFDQRVRFVFRHLPLEEIHPNALRAAQVAEYAGGQGRFWEMHDLLFENQRHLELRRLRGYVRRLGLDMALFAAAMNGEIYLRRVREHQRSGEYSGVRATPTFFVNGRIQDVSYGLLALFDAVADGLRSLTPDNDR